MRAAFESFVCKAGRFFLPGDGQPCFAALRQQYIDELQSCQHRMYMNFKTATDRLGLSASRLAEEFGLQPQTIRQMRLAPDAASYRSPPEGWRKVLARLARERSSELQDLAKTLEGESAEP